MLIINKTKPVKVIGTIVHISSEDSLKTFKEWFIASLGSKWQALTTQQKRHEWDSAMRLRHVLERKVYANPYIQLL